MVTLTSRKKQPHGNCAYCVGDVTIKFRSAVQRVFIIACHKQISDWLLSLIKAGAGLKNYHTKIIPIAHIFERSNLW